MSKPPENSKLESLEDSQVQSPDDSACDPADPYARDELFWRTRLFDSLSYPSVIINPDRTVVGANKKFLNIYALKLSDIVGKKCFHSFLYKDTPCDSEDCPIAKVLKHKDVESYTVKRQYRWEERVFSPIFSSRSIRMISLALPGG